MIFGNSFATGLGPVDPPARPPVTILARVLGGPAVAMR